MKRYLSNESLYGAWAGLYIVCALLGFIPNPQGLVKAMMVLVSGLFFVPGSMLLYRSGKTGDRKVQLTVCILSALSLALTTIALALNFMTVGAPEAAGDAFHALLVVVSAPMVSGGYWIVSLFAWACLLMTAISMLKKKK